MIKKLTLAIFVLGTVQVWSGQAQQRPSYFSDEAKSSMERKNPEVLQDILFSAQDLGKRAKASRKDLIAIAKDLQTANALCAKDEDCKTAHAALHAAQAHVLAQKHNPVRITSTTTLMNSAVKFNITCAADLTVAQNTAKGIIEAQRQAEQERLFEGQGFNLTALEIQNTYSNLHRLSVGAIPVKPQELEAFGDLLRQVWYGEKYSSSVTFEGQYCKPERTFTYIMRLDNVKKKDITTANGLHKAAFMNLATQLLDKKAGYLINKNNRRYAKRKLPTYIPGITVWQESPAYSEEKDRASVAYLIAVDEERLTALTQYFEMYCNMTPEELEAHLQAHPEETKDVEEQLIDIKFAREYSEKAENDPQFAEYKTWPDQAKPSDAQRAEFARQVMRKYKETKNEQLKQADKAKYEVERQDYETKAAQIVQDLANAQTTQTAAATQATTAIAANPAAQMAQPTVSAAAGQTTPTK